MEKKIFEYYGFNYETLSETEVALISARNANGRTVIPSEVVDNDGNKFNVVAIGKSWVRYSYPYRPDKRKKPETRYSSREVGAFESVTIIEFDNYHAKVQICKATEVVLPNTIRTLCDNAFSGTGLKQVEFLGTLEEIPKSCFSYTGLKSINLPTKLKVIGKRAFYRSELEKITIPSSVSHIDSYAFRGNNLKIVNILNEDGRVIIHPEAFEPDTQIVYLGLPEDKQVKITPQKLQEDVHYTKTIDLEKLIEAAVIDGVITEKERSIILKKASAVGYDADEVEILLDAKLYKIQQSALFSKQIEPTPKQQRSVALESKTTEPVALDLAEAKRKKGNLQVRISDWKKKGKDVTVLQQELAELNEYIKNQK